MESKNTLFVIILILICLFCIFFTVFLFRHAKNMESEYKTKEASLIKESMDLKDQIDNIKITIREKEKEINAVKTEKDALVLKIKSIEEENKKMEELYTGRIKVLVGEKETLSAEIKALKETSLAELIEKARDAEENENIKKMLERTLHNIELIRSGNVVDLEPIIVAEGEGPRGATEIAIDEMAIYTQDKSGEVLSIDRNNNLIVISLGTRDRIREGVRLAILENEEEIASGEIISSRYKISAAFIDDIKYGHTIHDIKNGYKVLVRR